MPVVIPTGPQFEDEVRNIARSLYSNVPGQGSQTIDGRERDGVFWNGQFYTVVEATTLRTKEKAETDGKKTHDLVTKLRQQGHMAHGFLVTMHEPTPDQKYVVKKKFERTTKIISFDELRSQLFDALRYINNREKKRFGSVYDHVDGNYDIPVGDFVEPTFTNTGSPESVNYSDLLESIAGGGRTVLVAEYGVGKSMVLRQLFYDLVKRVRTKRHYRTPIAINLREHLGQTDPIELLERHARANAANPQNLVAAWNAGYVDLLIDGFDELSTRGWTGDVRRLKEYRRSSHSVVRKLIRETPRSCGIIIAGRDAYFDSFSEMRESLGTTESHFAIWRVHPFDIAQSMEFLKKKSFVGELPEWVPTRPLLLTYLATKGLLQSVLDAKYEGDYPRGTAWLSLLDMIAARESEQSEGIDKSALLVFMGALGIRARHAPDNQTSFSPQQMESIFTEVVGATIMEDERNLLLRLPGLGSAPDTALNRSFIDHDLLNVCCARPICDYAQNPYADYQAYRFDLLSNPLSQVGIEALAAQFENVALQGGVVVSSVQRSLSDGLHQLAFDLFGAAQITYGLGGKFAFEGIDIEEVDLSFHELENVEAVFTGCLIRKVILPLPEETNVKIKFDDCLIGSVEGRVSTEDLDRRQFIGCEISEFTEEYNVNSQVLDTSLPLGVRVLVVTLRKLFTQSGSSRLESALFRGLDQRSKMLVRDVIELLQKEGFVLQTGRKGKVTYTGTKAKRDEAIRIIQAPNLVKAQILREAAKLS